MANNGKMIKSKELQFLAGHQQQLLKLRSGPDRTGAPQEFIDLAPLYWEIAQERVGVNPAVAYVQFAHETGYLYRDGQSMAGIDASWKNPCGLKTTEGGSNTNPSAHKKFESWEEGITAQVDHLALYAGTRGGTQDKIRRILDTSHILLALLLL